MNVDEKLEKVKILMDELDIFDEDLRQDIYLRALMHTEDESDVDILSNVINPVIFKYFKDILGYRKTFTLSGLMNNITNGPYTDLERSERNQKLKDINEVAKSFSMLHPYIIEEVYMKGTNSSDIANKLHISEDMANAVIESVLSDIQKVLK